MRRSKSGFFVLVFASVLLATFFSIYPIPETLASLRPELMCLLVIYFITSYPQNFGIVFGWAVGLLLDVFEGGVWGAHALALTLIAYICIGAHQRIKNYSIWHQTLWMFVLVGIHQVIVNWVQGLAGYETDTVFLVLSAALSALLWPPLFLVLTRIRLHYRLA
ncbi:MAG: rod shape-determining protein MreD [Agarilytica sp.]